MESIITDVHNIDFENITTSDMNVLNSRGLFVFFRCGVAVGYEYDETLYKL